MKLLMVVLFFILLPGCGPRQHPLRQIVVLVDTSASIEPDSEAECIDSLLTLAEKMERGDKLTIIPVTGDAEVDSTGRVLRFEKPINRTAYDADLVGFLKKVQKSVTEFRSWAKSHHAGKTDILGGIRMAAEEFSGTPQNQERILIIFSDFIEDDGAVDFKSDQHVATEQAALKYATQKAKQTPVSVAPAHVSMALLRSKDLRRLNKERRDAIRAFWFKYFASFGSQIRYITDGSGLLSSTISSR